MQLVTTRQGTSGVLVKVGTLDDPCGLSPRIAICHVDAQKFNAVTEGSQVFAGLPGI
ncbi:hypothetical protein [uncultured Tateyamaria sp.]|uniref:hypothetical protein n=1 Tax=uncultured Tateyamaria sp. TaxID=455651 RepID=UPI00262906CB|nr:hypothetical protein [uncultured Tateyamaria sp.]